jgi:hypothetical protein
MPVDAATAGWTLEARAFDSMDSAPGQVSVGAQIDLKSGVDVSKSGDNPRLEIAHWCRCCASLPREEGAADSGVGSCLLVDAWGDLKGESGHGQSSPLLD